MHDLVKWVHILSGAVLFGTGMGIAFFMLMAGRTRDAPLIARVAGIVVTADFLFTASAVVIQPLTGLMLASIEHWSLSVAWIRWSLILYLLVGLCWLPVVAIQIRLRNLARSAADEKRALGRDFDRLYRVWVLLGIPAFAGVIAIYWLMVAKPG